MPIRPSSAKMRTIGVSWLTKAWMASVRFTLGLRSTMRTSTRSIFATCTSLHVKHFVHVRPPLGLLAGGERDLAGAADGVPFLEDRLGVYAGEVGAASAAVIFEIAEQKRVLLEDRIVLHMGFLEEPDDLRPDRR